MSVSATRGPADRTPPPAGWFSCGLATGCWRPMAIGGLPAGSSAAASTTTSTSFTTRGPAAWRGVDRGVLSAGSQPLPSSWCSPHAPTRCTAGSVPPPSPAAGSSRWLLTLGDSGARHERPGLRLDVPGQQGRGRGALGLAGLVVGVNSDMQEPGGLRGSPWRADEFANMSPWTPSVNRSLGSPDRGSVSGCSSRVLCYRRSDLLARS